MAENKKSFIAYSDWYEMFKALPDDVAGKLIKHIFSYVNDENPSTDDFIINALFAQVKSTLKRDLVKWEEQRQQRSEAGKRSAEIRLTKFNERSTTVNETERNSTVNVSVSDNVNDNVSKKDFDAKSFLLQLLVEKQVAVDFLKNRKTKRLANTETAFKQIVEEINKTGLTSNDCIKIAVENGWGGFKSIWLNNLQYGTNKQSNSKNQGASIAEIAAAAERVFGDLPDR